MTEPERICEFCEERGHWPSIFWAPPFWMHSSCLIKAVEEVRCKPAVRP